MGSFNESCNTPSRGLTTLTGLKLNELSSVVFAHHTHMQALGHLLQIEEESGEESDGPDTSSGTLAKVAASTSQQPKATKLVLEEKSSQGGVSSAVIMKYVRALGGVPWALYLVFGFAAVEALRVGATVWLSVWTGEPCILQRHNSHCLLR